VINKIVVSIKYRKENNGVPQIARIPICLQHGERTPDQGKRMHSVDEGCRGRGQGCWVLARHGLSFQDIKLIVVTHAHVDHAGSAYELRELSGAPIVAHLDDAKYFSREVPMTFCPTGWFGRQFLKAPLIYEPYTGFMPDILLSEDETLDLSCYGIDGMIRHPGHTAGSISVELPVKML
jgi:glyoxylase-like metal-dependent hydrolase (beta-lactamase superfamily II)